MLKCQMITQPVRVEEIVEEWDRLLETTPCDPVFCSSAWFLSSCKANPPQSLCVFTARRDGVLTGLLPLVVRDHVVVFVNNMATYNDLIADPEDRETLLGLMRYVSSIDHLEQFDLGDCLPECNLFLAMKLSASSETMEQSYNAKPCTHIALPGDYESFLASQSYQFRKNLRRSRRKAERDGLTVSEVTLEDLDPDLLPDLFLELHMERFGDVSGFHRPTAAAFAREGLPELFRQGRLRIFGLFHEGEIAGIDIYLVGTSSFGSWNGGFRSELERWSPGKLMLLTAIETAIREGVGKMDFLRALQPWKLQWANGRHEVVSLEFQSGFLNGSVTSQSA